MKPQQALKIQKQIWQSFPLDKKIAVFGQWARLTRQVAIKRAFAGSLKTYQMAKSNKKSITKLSTSQVQRI